MHINEIERGGRLWSWPAYDTELIRVFDQVGDIDEIMRHVDARRTCIQAGGACGVWPARFSELFETVWTFEPDPLNFQCLAANAPRAVKLQAALGAHFSAGGVRMERVVSESTNAGAGYTRPGGPVPRLALDSLQPWDVDLIQFDLEGAELGALMGAAKTIARFRPVVVIEEKPLPQCEDHLAARRLLEAWGYREAARAHRDVVFTWRRP